MGDGKNQQHNRETHGDDVFAKEDKQKQATDKSNVRSSVAQTADMLDRFRGGTDGRQR